MLSFPTDAARLNADPPPVSFNHRRLCSGVALSVLAFALLAGSSADAAQMRRIQLPDGGALAGQAMTTDSLATALPAALGLETNAGFAIKSALPLPKNAGQSIRLDQTYNGVPVWSHQIVVHLGPDNQVSRVKGSVVTAIGDAPAPQPAFSPAAALQQVKQIVSQREAALAFEYRNEESQLVYFLHPEAKEGALQLAYRVSFYTDLVAQGGAKPTRPVYFIDAKSGEVLYSYENLQHVRSGTGPGGNTKTGQWTWGSNATFPNFHVTVSGATCSMADGSRIRVTDMNSGTSNTATFTFACYNNTTRTVNGAYAPMNDANNFGIALYEMYQAWYAIPPLNIPLWVRVHYGASYENAFWDGSSMSFGDGASTFFPLVGLDVMAHEVSHGFTSQHSNLTYSGQSGGMNEAFSDMAGEALEYYYSAAFGPLFPRTMPDYLVGAEIYKAAGQALRYMCNPTQDGRSIDHVRNYTAGMDVHYSSGVYNKAYCLLAQTAGWNPKLAFDVFVYANLHSWTANENFSSGANDVIAAATALGYAPQGVIAAFAAVGLPLPPVTNDAFVNATTISTGQTSVAGNNTNATKETGEPNITGNAGGASVWWKCTAASNGTMTISTVGSSFDTLLGAFTGTAVNALTLVAGDDDSGGNLKSRISFTATAGTVYRIVVDGFSAAQGSITLNMEANGCIGAAQSAIASHDFNGDGKSDILWRDNNGALVAWLMNGTSASSMPSYGTVAPNWIVVGQRDFNNDNKSDLLWWDSGSGMIAAWQMNGPSVNSVTSYFAVNGWSIVGAGDLNADFKADVIWRNAAGDIVVWLMNGTAISQVVSVGNVPPNWAVVGVADVNADNKVDIIWRESGGLVAVWLMSGTSVQQVATLGSVGPSWYVAATGDFNGDGKADILWRDSSGTTAIWQMNGASVGTVAVVGSVANNWGVAVTGDFNGDGKSDVLWRSNVGEVAMWTMNGTTVSNITVVGTVPTNWVIQSLNAN